LHLEIGRVDHQRLWNSGLGGQALQYPGEDALVAPALPTIVEGLRRPIHFRRIAPPQAVATCGVNATQHPPVIDARLAMALGNEWFQTGHLHFGQPEKDAQREVSLRRQSYAADARSKGHALKRLKNRKII
jgi:hypothetical protein